MQNFSNNISENYKTDLITVYHKEVLFPEKIAKRFENLIITYSEEDQRNIRAALSLATKYHNGQFRDDYTPYITHCITVANLAMEDRQPVAVVSTALLHDTLEDTLLTAEELETQFGQDVLSMVKLLSKELNGIKLPQEEYYTHISTGRSEVRRIKGYDRLSNILSLYYCPDQTKQKRYIKKTHEDILPMIEKEFPDITEKILLALEMLSHDTPMPKMMEEIQRRLRKKMFDVVR